MTREDILLAKRYVDLSRFLCRLESDHPSHNFNIYERSDENIRMYCPIHGGDNQRSLSFYKNDDDEWMFNCFSCHEYGDIIKFVSLVHGVGFKDAVDYCLQ